MCITGKVDGLVAFLSNPVPSHFWEDNLVSAQIFMSHSALVQHPYLFIYSYLFQRLSYIS